MPNPESHTLPVMKKHCATCPFKIGADGRMQNAALANEVQTRTLFKAHQICHGTQGRGKDEKWKSRCKGSFDANMVIYQRAGYAHLVK